jgi:anti-sigma B factor antagonist
MQYDVVRRGDADAEIRLRGRVTGDALAESKDSMASLVGDGAYRGRLFIDMAAADFLDSSGIGWLLEQHRQCLQSGGMMILHSIPPMVNRVMQLMNLHRAFHIAADPDAARTLAEQPPR